MRHLKPISLIAVVAMLGVFSFNAFSAITTTFDYNTPADFVLDTDYNQEITGGELVLGEQYEVQINDEIESAQFGQEYVLLDNGNFFVVWQSLDSDFEGNDNSSYHLAGKIVDSFGRTIVPEFQVNQFIDSLQVNAELVKLDNGNVMVVFASRDATEGDNDSGHIAGIVYDSSGEVVVDEFIVNELIVGNQTGVDAVKMSNSNVFVSWRSGDSEGTADTINDHVAAKILGPDGSTIVNEFLVNETYDDNQVGVVPLYLEGPTSNDDKVMVVWEHGTAGTYDLYAKIYNLDGTVSKSEFILVDDIGDQDVPNIIKLEDNVFFMVYQSSDTAVGPDVSGSAIEGKLIDMEGVEVLSSFEINDETENDQFAPVVSELSNGDLYVSWTTQDSDHSGTDNDSSHVAAKVLSIEDSGGYVVNNVTSEFQVNVGIEGSQQDNKVIVDNGNIYNLYYSEVNFVYGDDTDRHIAFLVTKEDLTYYKDVFSPSSRLASGVAMDESLRQVVVEYGSGNEGDVSMQISNDDGATWFYFNGDAWVETEEGVDESNTQNEVNTNLDTFYSDQGVGGTFNVKLFLNSDGTEEVIVDTLSILENEVPIIGNGDASVSVDVEENETRVAQFVSTDPETDDVTYSITAGEDAELFSITESGLLSISLDGDLGEIYQVVVRSTDEFGGVSDQTVNVTVVRVAPSNGSSSGGSTPNPFGGTLTVDNETEVATQNEEPKVKVQQGLFYNFFLESLGFDFAEYLYDLFN